MSAHRFSSDARGAFALGAAYGDDPGAGGTFELSNKSGLIFEVPGAGDTRVLPAEDSVPIGTTLVVMNTTTSALTINDDAAGTVVTLADEEAAEIMLCQTSDERKWLAVIYAFGIT